MNFIKSFIVSVFLIFLLCLIQISILNPLFLGCYSYIYVLFILVYPYNRNRFVFLFLSFLIGCIIDHCMNSGGIHAFSATLSAFLRLNFLQFFDGKNFINRNDFSIYELPFIRKTLYIFSLVFTHHFSLLILEILKGTTFSKIILFRTIFSSIFTTILCIIYFFFRKIKH
ncbi:hypothetical protein BLBBGE_003 [Blattabacterium sp. (Blattella germanica) str. Bge]|uniref:hypothetical protein n=1 Tax=Blattabacterium sp. (Blattella germanica) TaxID=624186 RepID=UPI0001BB628E|nr:hypothetical protein [Blattabacterium sp. (Blattella germanica)]ACY40041.1 hypothetical protein BLBBGE_003 [Blattabacterium sp. (Blattella germanica) str. Bge]